MKFYYYSLNSKKNYIFEAEDRKKAFEYIEKETHDPVPMIDMKLYSHDELECRFD